MNLEIGLATPEDIDRINERLAKASPEAAYALGLLTALTLRYAAKMPDVILDGAMTVKTMPEALEYAKAVWELRDDE
jgi:hypothetical protein